MVNTKSLVFELCVLKTVADLEIQKKRVSGMHIVYGRQKNNMSTHTIFSTHTSKFFKCPWQLRLTVELGPNNTLYVINLSIQ